MSDFKVGDTVWFGFTSAGRSAWKDSTVFVMPFLVVTSSTIVAISQADDYIHLYIDGELDVASISYVCRDDMIFNSKQDCIDAFKERLDEL